MANNTSSIAENICQQTFSRLGECYHLCTPENNNLIFRNDMDFKIGISILGLCALCFPDISILAFQFMNNHLHLVLAGPREVILEFYNQFANILQRHPQFQEQKEAILRAAPKLHEIKDLDYMRKVIAYVIRNGFIVNPQFTPMNYPWGTNRFMFNEDAVLRYDQNRTRASIQFIREQTHSRLFDHTKNAFILDGGISPLCYCRCSDAEKLFRDARQYFYMVSKNIETQRDIAKTIGESIYYTDNDLYVATQGLCSKLYGCQIAELAVEQKMEMAGRLHFEYNASNKQIARILKVEVSLLDTLLGR